VERQPVAAGLGNEHENRRPDFFVSYTSSDRTWAEWIAWQLEDAGHVVVIQAWDFRPGSDFVAAMREAASTTERTLAVLSPDYLGSPFALCEWTAAFAADPLGRQGKLVPVRVAEFDAQGLDRTRVWIDLVGLDEDWARRRLLDGVSQARAKPERPPAYPRTRIVPTAPRFPASLPPVWNLPHHPNPNFTGREDLLAALSSAPAGEASVLTQAITGLGGVGKTQVAVEYAYSHRRDYEVVWWVRAEEPLTLVQDFAALAPVLGLAVDSDLDATVVAVRAWLESHDGWLVIFDNATDPAALESMLPRGGGGRVVVTSRNPSWGALANVLPVDVLSPDDSVAFLCRRSGDEDTRAAAQLARALGQLPLAMEQAGAFVEQTPAMTLRAYLELFRARAGEVLARGRVTGYPATVATTWELAFQAVHQASPAATVLLQLCAFVDPDDIPVEPIVAAGRWPEPLGTVARDPLGLAEALGHLGRFSLISSGAGELVAVHRLVQLVVRERMSGPERRAWTGRVVKAVRAAFPADSGDISSWDQCARLLPHALAASTHPGAAEGDAAEATSWLLDRAATYLRGQGRFSQARERFERALAIAEAAYGPDHPEVGTRLNNLAMVLRDLGDLAGAKERFERAQAIAEAAYGSDHPAVGTLLNNLATVLRDLGDLAGAKERFERALSIAEAAYGPDHPEVGTSLNNVAMVLQDLGDLAGAKERLERALSIAEAAYGPDHSTVGTRLNNVAMVLRDLGDLAGAKERVEPSS
jgi:tetratricopeptide (TPR) repeat protein